MEYNLFCKLKEAWETSTLSNNRFKSALDRTNWETTFEADGETYFCIGGFSLTVENVNPFEEKRKPSAIFSDGSYVSF